MSEKKSPKRWSAKRKQEVVLRLLRGESLDTRSRETGQPGSVLSGWRDDFLETGLVGLKRRTDDPKVAALEKELKRAQRLVGDLMMDKELLEMRIARHEGEPLFSGGDQVREAGACSVSAERVYGKARVCRRWGVPRSTHYARQVAAERPVRPRRRGRRPALPG